MLAVLLLLTLLVLSPVLLADFIRLDDYSHLLENPHLQRMSVAGLAGLWTKSYFNLYIPLTYSAWWTLTMLGSLFGPMRQNAWLFHSLNLTVHLANVTLVFFLVRSLLGLIRQKTDPPDPAADKSGEASVALISALFFAIHPVQVETVAWVSELKGGLSMMFGLLGLGLHLRLGRRLPTAACFVAAMLAKPSAIVFPVMVFLVDRILLGADLRKSAIRVALHILPMLPFVVFTKLLQPDLELDFVPSMPERFIVALDALTFYLAKLLWPFSLGVDYGLSPQYVLHHLPGWRLALSLVFAGAGLAVVLKALFWPIPNVPKNRGGSLAACGWAIFLLALAPVLGFVSFGFQDFSTVADHYLYAPLFGVSLMVAGALLRYQTWAGSPSNNIFSRCSRTKYVAGAILLVFAVLSFQQARRWRSTESLLSQTVQVNPLSYLGYSCIGEEYLRAGRLDQSLEWLSKSIALNPDYLSAQISLGMVWASRGEFTKAIEHYRAVLAKNPSALGTRARPVSSLHNNLGMQLLQVGQQEEAVEQFQKAIEIFPRSLNAHLNLGNLALGERRFSEAVSEFEKAQAINPSSPAIRQRLELARQYARQQAQSEDTPAPPSP